MAKQSTKPRMVSLSFTVFLVLLGIIAGILGTHFVAAKYYKMGMKNSLYGKYMRDDKMKKYNECDAVVITNPTKGQQVTDPLEVTVVVENAGKNCQWTVFEAQAGTMELKDSTGQVVGTGVLTTEEEWMTDGPVEYTGTIDLVNTPANGDLMLTITEDDPSGQSQQQVTLPLTY